MNISKTCSNSRIYGVFFYGIILWSFFIKSSKQRDSKRFKETKEINISFSKDQSIRSFRNTKNI